MLSASSNEQFINNSTDSINFQISENNNQTNTQDGWTDIIEEQPQHLSSEAEDWTIEIEPNSQELNFESEIFSEQDTSIVVDIQESTEIVLTDIDKVNF